MSADHNPVADYLENALKSYREGSSHVDVTCPLSARAAHLLLSLFTYMSRLRWMKEQLDQDALSGGTTATLIAVNMNTVGYLRSERDWEYELFGLELWLKNVVTGEVIAGRLDALDDYFLVFQDFSKWLESLDAPCFAGARLLALHPSTPSIRISLAELVENGLIEQDFPNIWIGECCDHARTEWDVVRPLLDDEDLRGDFAETINDREYLLDERGHELEPDKWQDLYGSSKENWHRRLEDAIEDDELFDLALRAMAENDHRLCSATVSTLLAADRNTTYVLELIFECEIFESYPAVVEVLRRSEPDSDAWGSAAEGILKAGLSREEICEKLDRVHDGSRAWAAEVALTHAPSRCPELFARALALGNCEQALYSAAELAILDEPWSRKLAIDGLNASTPGTALPYLALLLVSTWPEARQQIDCWLEQNMLPPLHEFSKTLKLDFFHQCISDLSESIVPLRGRVQAALDALRNS